MSTSTIYLNHAGLLAHKWVEAVALATSFIKSKRSQSASLLFIGMFACATPFGILIGILLSFTRSVAVEATFTAVAAGTFVYVGCNEVSYLYIYIGGNVVYIKYTE